MNINRIYLSSDYLPKLLPHRENQIKLLAKKIENFVKHSIESNIFIHGSPGIGKTATVKFVSKLAEENYNIKCIYINCWKNNTEASVLYEINRQFGIITHRRGLGTDELFDRFIEGLTKITKRVCIIMDEVDKLEKRENLLYKFSRLDETSNKPLFIFIANKKDIFRLLDPRIQSSMFLDKIEFKKYTLEELKDIFDERIKLAFENYEVGCSLLVANYSFNHESDVRYGLKLLLRASYIVEDENAKKLKVEHIKKAMKEIDDMDPKKESMIKQLKKELADIIGLLKEENGITTTSKLFEKYRTIYPITVRTFRNYLKKLKESGIIEIEEHRGGERGSKFFVKLKV